MSRSRKSLVALAVGYFMVVLDVTVVTVAVPTIGKDLHAGVTGLQWMVDGYSLVFAALLLFGGALGDRLGGKPVFLSGLAVFGLASAACGLSPDTGGLVAARLVQGLGAALMVPTALLLVHASYDTGEERARAIGVWGGVAGIAAAIGPVIGGVLVTALGWRGVFLVNVPVACAAFALAARYAPAPVPARRHGLDILGLLASVIGFAGLITAVNEAGAEGWTAPVVLVGFAMFAAAGLGFLMAERYASEPAVPLGMFSSGEFSASAAIGMLLNAGFFGLIFIAPLYFQRELHYDPVQAGLAMIPAVVSPVLASRWAGKLTGRTGPRLPAVAGLLIGAAGLLGCLVAGRATPYALLVVPLAAAGMAPTLVVPATTFATVESAPQDRVGAASAIYNTARQFGSAFGVALFGSLAAGSLLSGLRLGMITGAVAFIGAAAVGMLLLSSRRADAVR